MINYKYISEAIDFYTTKCRFDYLEVPWFCSLDALNFTKPPEKRTCESFLGHLVGSGEQSFIELWLKGRLPQGRYLCATPCFRDEEILDKLHRNYFIKVELIFSEPDNPSFRLSQMIGAATYFFEKYCKIDVIKTDIGYDIIENTTKIELGSYGIRNTQGFHWVYGTGVAEPRLSQVLEEIQAAS